MVFDDAVQPFGFAFQFAQGLRVAFGKGGDAVGKPLYGARAVGFDAAADGSVPFVFYQQGLDFGFGQRGVFLVLLLVQGGGLGFDLGFQAALCVQQCAVLLQNGFFFFGRVVFQRGF